MSDKALQMHTLSCCTTHDQRRLTTNNLFDPISSSGLHDVFIHALHTSRGEMNEMTETISREGSGTFFPNITTDAAPRANVVHSAGCVDLFLVTFSITIVLDAFER